MIGEDAGGMIPSKLMFLAGAETWGLFTPIDKATWRLHVEYADTSARYNLDGNPDDVRSFAYNVNVKGTPRCEKRADRL